MGKQEFSAPKLASLVRTEADAYELLERLRWNGEPVCPHCGVIGGHYFLKPANGTARKTRTGSLSQRRVWKCHACRKQFSVLTGTVFHGSKIPVRTWVLVIFDMCAAKNGVSAREIERRYELAPKTAWFMLHRIREAMRRDPLAGLLRGTVVADETWIGGKPQNRHADKRRTREQWTDQQPVMALVDYETREVRSRAVADVTADTLAYVIEDEVEVNRSQLWTDGATAYKTIGTKANSHKVVNHHQGEYKRDGASTNLAEGYFSQLKRSVDGTFHHVSREHLGRYLTQFDFMYSYCKDTDSQRMRRVLRNVGGRRLTYMPLTGR